MSSSDKAPTGRRNKERRLAAEPSRASQSSKREAPATLEQKPLESGLYVTATPIGNAADVTLRALDVLARADLVLAEDTRVTAKLLAIHGVRAKELLSYREENAERVTPGILERLNAGASVVIVTDAGTPLISDPGGALVRAAIDAGIEVKSVPGASALVAALSIAGLDTARVLFAGFLPERSAARRSVLAELGAVPATLVFYEAPHRLAESLADLRDVLGDRRAAVAREITKLFEEVRRGSLGELGRHYADHEARGEIVIVVAPPSRDVVQASDGDVDAALDRALETMSLKDAAAAVAGALGLKRKRVYDRALARRRHAP